MKLVKYISFVFVVGFSLSNFAQQEPHYTQYLYNMVVLNPAYAGARADLSLGLLSRTQWVGIDGAPKTQTFSLNTRVFEGFGIGLSAIHDKLGLVEESNVFADVSYTVITSNKSTLSFGLKGGLSLVNNDLEAGVTPDHETYSSTKRAYPNFGFGVYYQTEKIFAGFSIPRIFKTPKFKLSQDTFLLEVSESLNYFGNLSMRIKINDRLLFKPSILVKVANNIPVSIDLNTNFLFNEKFEFGISYRYDDSISALIAFLPYKSMRIGYAYDLTLTDLAIKNLSTHEIILTFDFDFKKNKRWLRNSSCYF